MGETAHVEALIEAHRNELDALCRAFHVKRLDVFGSVTRDDFDPARSDLDFLVLFDLAAPIGALHQYFGFKEALEELFGRSVDLVEAGAVRNPYLRESIERNRRTLYAA